MKDTRDTRRMLDKVHSALQEVLDAAGIEMPNDAVDVYPRHNGKDVVPVDQVE
jgi:hypothetical protein